MGRPSRLRRSYLARRLLTLFPVWLGISILAFFVGHLAPGDPGEAILTSELGRPPTANELQGFYRSLGLRRSLASQYWHWLTSAVHGNLGRSYRSGATVLHLLAARFPATLELSVASLVIALAVAVPL